MTLRLISKMLKYTEYLIWTLYLKEMSQMITLIEFV